MVTAADIREILASYIANGIDLDTLEERIAQRTWNVHQSQDLTATHLAYATELLLSEYSDDHLPEAELREKISLLVQTPIAQVDHMVLSGSFSSNRSIPTPAVNPWQRPRVGTGFAERYA